MNSDLQFLFINIALSLTTFVLIAVGIQLILVLHEIRKTIKKIYFILDSFEEAGINVKEGLSEIAGFLNGMKIVLKLASKIKAKNKNG